MRRTIGVSVSEHVATGLVEDNKVIGPLSRFPEEAEDGDALQAMPAEAISAGIVQQVELVAKKEPVDAVGVGFPGLIRDGVVEESPNLQQAKGFNFQAALSSALQEHGVSAPVRIFNNADAMAAGVAATRGHLDRLIRVWFLGHGVGFGRYPWIEGAWEGGHSVVTLDPKENFCGCGGVGHLEGVMGHRAMRLRFLDMEPEEIFEHAKAGDERCANFARLWHRALAAATATSVHLEGPGRFFISGPNAGFVDLTLLSLYMHEMVKMSPLQGSAFEVISTSDEIGVIGAAVNAARATFGG